MPPVSGTLRAGSVRRYIRVVFARRRRRFLDTYAFPPGLEVKLAAARPELSATDRALVLEGLRDWFVICASARGPRFYAMPSRAVDDAWHELILFTREYRELCRRGLGRYLDHTPAEGMTAGTSMEDGALATWRAACVLEGIDAGAPDRLPRIFAVDERVGIEDGVRYAIDPGGDPPFRATRPGVAATGGMLGTAGPGSCGGAFAGCGGGSSGAGDGGGVSGGCGGGGCGGG